MIQETLTNLILHTHPLVSVLRLLSVLCFAMILDRLVFWLVSGLRYRPLPPEIYDVSTSGKDRLLAQLRKAKRRHYTRELLLVCLEAPDSKDRIGQTVSEIVDRMSSTLNALELIAKVAPLVGILGTVIGLIVSFCAVGAMANASPTAISKGLGVALKTTADGLVISICASVACVGFKWCIHRALLKMGRIVCGAQQVANIDDAGPDSGHREQ